MKRKRTTKKRFDLKVLARRVYYTSAPSGPCKRHKGCMLRTANNEYSSLSRQFDVCAAGVVRVLIQYRVARDTKGNESKRNEKNKKLTCRSNSTSLTYGVRREGL